MVAPEHEARMDVSCVACGESTTESVYRIRRTQRLTCRSCGASIDLTPEQVGLDADRAEREWRRDASDGEGGGRQDAS